MLTEQLAHEKRKLQAAENAASEINAAWREERQQWAALDPARGLETAGLVDGAQRVGCPL